MHSEKRKANHLKYNMPAVVKHYLPKVKRGFISFHSSRKNSKIAIKLMAVCLPEASQSSPEDQSLSFELTTLE